MTSSMFYSAGTVTLAASTSLVFSGTDLLSNVKPGDELRPAAGGSVIVESVEDAEHLTVYPAWAGATGSGLAYRIVRGAGWSQASIVNSNVVALLARLKQGTLMAPHAYGEKGTTARDAYDEQFAGFLYLDVPPVDSEDVSVMYVKLSDADGDWGIVNSDVTAALDAADAAAASAAAAASSASAAAGSATAASGSATAASGSATAAAASAAAAEVAKMDWESAWSSVTAYAVSDVVQYGGSSWIAIQAGTNQTPPTLPTTSNSYWELVASRGNPGAVAGARNTFRVYNPDEDPVPTGTVITDSNFRGGVTFDRMYAKITAHSGSAEITLCVNVNGTLAHSLVVKDTAAEIDTGLTIPVVDGDEVSWSVLAVVGDVWGVEAWIDSPAENLFPLPVTFSDDVTFSDHAKFATGSAASPSIRGPQGQGFHFPTDKVGIASLGVNWFRGGKDDLVLTMDTLLLVARTTGSGGHGYPQIAIRNEDKVTRDGAGGFIRFQSYNTSDALIEAQINGGAVIATAGAEQSGYDFGGLRNGAYEVLFAMSAYENMAGPVVDAAYDAGRSSYRYRNGFFSGYVRFGSFTVGTVPSAATAGAGAMIFVSNETGGAVMAFSDGTNWRRVTDRNVIS